MILERMDAFFDSRLDGYEEHQLTCIAVSYTHLDVYKRQIERKMVMELGERKQKILAAIIDAYIQTGEPVGSKALVEMLDNAVSSATIRNDMARCV